jgi:hypothetical protein
MAFIKKRRQWDSQPQETVSLNLDRFPDAVLVVNPGSGGTRNIATDEEGYQSGSADISIGDAGRSIKAVSGIDGYFWIVPSRSIAEPWTVLLDVQIDGPSTAAKGFLQIANFTATSGGPFFLLQQNNTDLRVYTASGYRVTESGVLTQGSRHKIAVTYDGTVLTVVRNGLVVGTYSTTSLGVSVSTRFWIGNGYNGSAPTSAYFAGYSHSAISIQALCDLTGDVFWRLFNPKIIHVPVSAGGATTHATSGALAAAGATLAGTAAHIAKHTTSGVLAGSGAAVAGSSARTRAHPTSGALAGAGATLAGAADHVVPGGTHDTSGTLTGAGAAVAGSAAHIAKHATSGALAGSGATLAGSAARVAAAVTHATSGALVGDGAVVTGLATGPNVSFGGGSWFPNVGKRTRKDDDELTQEVVEAVAAAPKARQKLTLANLIGKTAAAQVSREELDKAVSVVKRKKRRQDDELMLLM